MQALNSAYLISDKTCLENCALGRCQSTETRLSFAENSRIFTKSCVANPKIPIFLRRLHQAFWQLCLLTVADFPIHFVELVDQALVLSTGQYFRRILQSQPVLKDKEEHATAYVVSRHLRIVSCGSAYSVATY